MPPFVDEPLEAIIFDLGNTLIYFEDAWPEVLARADAVLFRYLGEAGLDLDEAAFLENYRAQLESYYQERETEFVEYTTQYILRELLAEWGYPDAPESILRPALNAMYAVTQAHWQPEVDALPTLQALKERGYYLGMISNAGDDADVQTLVDKAQMRPYFDLIVTSAASGIRKPNPRIFQPLLDLWRLPPKRVAMVGDTLGADILGAHNAGIFSIWITRRADVPANRAHLDTILPDATIETLEDLLPLLEGLKKKGG